MKCPKCTHENDAADSFCEECGIKLTPACPSCGRELKAAAKFCPKCGQSIGPDVGASKFTSPGSYTPKHLADKILNFRDSVEGERKTITALFADIKGSMELMEDLDPEEARRVIEPAVQLMMDGVHRYEGYVAQSAGDGIFAMFGAPIAHEDHAQRALYAALLMQDSMAKYSEKLREDTGIPIHIRVGINTGEVVVRSIRKDDLHTDYDPIGHSTGLAARMEAIAAQGSVLVSEHTHQLTEGYFQFNDLGVTKIKGVSDPVHIYEVEGVGPLRTRLEVSASRGLVRFIGRKRELAQMHEALESAKEGHGQIVAIMGEAGVGKSRLVYEFKVVQESKCLVLDAFSVSHGKAHAYLPLIDLLKNYFRINLQDDERRRREKVAGKVIMPDRALEDALPYLFCLLGISEPASSLQQMDPRIRRQRTMDAIKRLLVRESLNQPLLLIFEDLHWIDAETQEFLDLLCGSLATANIMLLVNYRPEYEHGWTRKTYYTRLRLDPLGKKEAGELLGVLLGNGARSKVAPLKKLILERTEGNPFFMEELVQTLAEQNVLVGVRGDYRLEKTTIELQVPETVQGVLTSRIDRLVPEEKKLLQTLAVVGKEFPLGLVREVVEQGEDELHGLLSRLQATEFVYEQPAFPEPEYTFKHALTQEVAYGSVLLERRKLMHERTAQAIETLYQYRLEEHYHELARHYSRTDNTEKAVEYLRLAAQQAVQRSAPEEAIGQLRKGLELIERMPETSEREEQELLLLTTLGPALAVTKSWAAPEVEQTYERARDLCEGVGETQQLFQTLYGLATFHYYRAESQKALELGERLLSLGERYHDTSVILVAHQRMGATLDFLLGKFAEGRDHLEKGIALYDPTQHHALTFRYGGFDPGIACFANDGLGLAVLGYLDQALARVREAVRLAEERSHAYSLANGLLNTSWVQQLRGEWRAAQESTEALIALSTEHGFPFNLAVGRAQLGRALAEQGQVERGIGQLLPARDAMRAMGVSLARPWGLVTLAELYMRARRSSEGLACIADALGLVDRTGERFSEAWVHRTKGEILLLESEDDEAEQCFQKAINVAREQQAKWYELRAATSLARLWREHGKKDEARKLLSEIYGWFTEGFDTAVLKEAKALLDELS